MTASFRIEDFISWRGFAAKKQDPVRPGTDSAGPGRRATNASKRRPG